MCVNLGQRGASSQLRAARRIGRPTHFVKNEKCQCVIFHRERTAASTKFFACTFHACKIFGLGGLADLHPAPLLRPALPRLVFRACMSSCMSGVFDDDVPMWNKTQPLFGLSFGNKRPSIHTQEHRETLAHRGGSSSSVNF